MSSPTLRAQSLQPWHRDTSRTVLVTGAASGIGKAIARRYLAEGFRVYATDIDTVKLAALEPEGCQTLFLDVTDEESIVSAFAKLEAAGHHIDILVNNAGYGQNGFVEELGLNDLRRQFEVNVFGVIRVSQEAIPAMRELGRGMIINIGSVGGDFTSPGASAYHASKYAIESFSDGMRQELRQFGIDVVLIKPGGVNTAFTENARAHYPAAMPASPYTRLRQNFLAMTDVVLDPEKSSYPILAPEEVASVVLKASCKRKPAPRYRVGVTSKLMPVILALRGDRGFDKMMLKSIGGAEAYKANAH